MCIPKQFKDFYKFSYKKMFKYHRPEFNEKYNNLVDFSYRIVSMLILLFSIWVVSILIYYSFKNKN